MTGLSGTKMKQSKLSKPPRKKPWPFHDEALRIIVVVALLAFFLTFLAVVSGPAVGQAINGPGGSSAGLVYSGGMFTITITPATTPGLPPVTNPVNAVYVELDGASALCNAKDDIMVSGLGDVSLAVCEDGDILVGGGSASQLWTGPFSFTISLRNPLPPGSQSITMWPVDVYAEGEDIFPDTEGAVAHTPFMMIVPVTPSSTSSSTSSSSTSSSSSSSSGGMSSSSSSGSGTNSSEVEILPSFFSSSGGGPSCSSNWTCGDWGLCTAQLEQKRDCVDKGCKSKPIKEEFRRCEACQESWVCSSWSSCSNGKERRICIDEHACGKALLKPEVQRSCHSLPPAGLNVPVQKQQPASGGLQLPAQPPVPEAAGWTVQKLWKEQKILVVGVPAGLVLIVAVLLLLLKERHLRRNRREMEDWVREAEDQGATPGKIREMLEQTGWGRKEIETVMG